MVIFHMNYEPHPASPTRLAPSCALPASSSPTFEPSILQPRNLFRINTCKSVSKQTTLTFFRMNTYEKQGGGEGRASVFPTRNSALNLESLLARSHALFVHSLRFFTKECLRTPLLPTRSALFFKTAGRIGISNQIPKQELEAPILVHPACPEPRREPAAAGEGNPAPAPLYPDAGRAFRGIADHGGKNGARDHIDPTASRKRLTTRAWPRTTIVSNSGGATAWPKMATRVALISNPAFTPAVSASARSAWSLASWFHSGSAASASASFASSSGTFGSFQNFSFAAGSIVKSSLKNARDHLEKSGSSRTLGPSRSTVFEN